MNKILDYISKETNGKNYKSYKFCIENVEVPRLEYEDKKEIIVKKIGETDKSLKKTKSLKELANKIANNMPLFKYFLDGSRRTYKVDDIAYNKKIYPVIAGQIGIGVCYRGNRDSFKAIKLYNHLVISLPAVANSETSNDDLFFNNLLSKLNKQEILQRQNLKFEKILPYKYSAIKDNDKYEDRGVAKIQDEMIKLEKLTVKELVQQKKLNRDTFLMKDGSLEYEWDKADLKNISSIKTNYASVVGVSKMFNPESLSSYNKNISRIIADLPEFHRTPAFMYETERIQNVKFAVWYLRIRKTVSPFDGILKIEKILVWDKEEEDGLDSDEIDLISANIINERTPVCYGHDKRWTKHLYPIFLTEKYIKSKYLSDYHFINLF
jgi:hypothetical protein